MGCVGRCEGVPERGGAQPPVPPPGCRPRGKLRTTGGQSLGLGAKAHSAARRMPCRPHCSSIHPRISPHLPPSPISLPPFPPSLPSRMCLTSLIAVHVATQPPKEPPITKRGRGAPLADEAGKPGAAARGDAGGWRGLPCTMPCRPGSEASAAEGGEADGPLQTLFPGMHAGGHGRPAPRSPTWLPAAGAAACRPSRAARRCSRARDGAHG